MIELHNMLHEQWQQQVSEHAIPILNFGFVFLARRLDTLPYMETYELQSIHSHPGMTGLTVK